MLLYIKTLSYIISLPFDFVKWLLKKFTKKEVTRGDSFRFIQHQYTYPFITGNCGTFIRQKNIPKVTVAESEFLPGNPGGSLPAGFTSPLAVTNVKGGMCATYRSKHPVKIVLVKKTVHTRETSGVFSFIVYHSIC